MRKKQRGDADLWVMLGLGALMVGLVALLIMASVADARQWTAFKVKHACKVVGKQSGDVMTTMVNGKIGVTVSPDKTGWLCDDGITYWR